MNYMSNRYHYSLKIYGHSMSENHFCPHETDGVYYFRFFNLATPFLLHGAPPAACPAGGVFVQSRACRHIHTEVFSISPSQERLISSFNFSPTLFIIRRHTVSCSDGLEHESDLKYLSLSPKNYRLKSIF